MASENHHFPASPLKAMLGLASRRLATSPPPPPTDELTASAIADAAPPESIFSATLSDIEAKCSYAATATTAESAEFAAATTPETTVVIPSDSPIGTEGHMPRESATRPLLQVWHEWPLCSALP
jgi:hypothetical protein